MMIQQLTRLPLAAALMLAAGCGGTPTTGSITGTVTYDGKPLDGGIISFVPATGNTVAAIIQADGAYSVANVPLGEAIVVIASGTSPASQGQALKEGKGKTVPAPKSPLTEKYGDANKPQLRFTV